MSILHFVSKKVFYWQTVCSANYDLLYELNQRLLNLLLLLLLLEFCGAL